MNLAAPRRRAALAFGLALVLVAAIDSAARAEGAGKDAEKEARRLFQSAELSFNVGKFAEALADYQAAYEAKPLPGFLFNIAQCYRNMGDYERARFFFRRYLSLDPRSPNRRRVEALTDEMTRKLQESPTPKAEPPKADTKPPESKPSEPPPASTASPGLIDSAKGPDAVAPPPVSLAAVPPPAESAAPGALVVAAPPGPTPVWKRWWFWTAAGVVLVGGTVAAFVLTRPETVAPGTLEPIDGR